MGWTCRGGVRGPSVGQDFGAAYCKSRNETAPPGPPQSGDPFPAACGVRLRTEYKRARARSQALHPPAPLPSSSHPARYPPPCNMSLLPPSSRPLKCPCTLSLPSSIKGTRSCPAPTHLPPTHTCSIPHPRTPALLLVPALACSGCRLDPALACLPHLELVLQHEGHQVLLCHCQLLSVAESSHLFGVCVSHSAGSAHCDAQKPAALSESEQTSKAQPTYPRW